MHGRRSAVYDANDNEIDELAALPIHLRDTVTDPAAAAAGIGNEESWLDVDPLEQQLLLQRNTLYQLWQQQLVGSRPGVRKHSSTQQEQQPPPPQLLPTLSSSSSSSSSPLPPAAAWPLGTERTEHDDDEKTNRRRPRQRRRQAPAAGGARE